MAPRASFPFARTRWLLFAQRLCCSALAAVAASFGAIVLVAVDWPATQTTFRTHCARRVGQRIGVCRAVIVRVVRSVQVLDVALQHKERHYAAQRNERHPLWLYHL